MVKNYKRKSCLLMDMSVPTDNNVLVKELNKISKYKELEIEIKKMWRLKTIIVSVIIYIYIYIYIYIVIHRQICFILSELISVARQYLPVAGIETRLTQTPSQSDSITLYIYIYIYIYIM